MSSDRTKLTNRQDGGEAILEAFRNLNVDYVISSPGSEWPPVWEALARQTVNKTKGPTYLSCWHETLAVDMANAESRAAWWKFDPGDYVPMQIVVAISRNEK